MAVDPFSLVQKTLAGAFLVESAVGEGRHSVVYRGRHVGPQETVAIKCLKLGVPLDAPQAETFLRRLRESSRENSRVAKGHPVFARSIGSGMTTADNGQHVPYTVIEWLEGRSLASDLAVRRLEQGARGRPFAEAFTLIEGPLEALAFAHAEGGHHGDVSPGSLFLSGGAAKVRLLDYGMMRVVSDVLREVAPAATYEPMFAAAYGAPEQFDASIGATGPWTDVYAIAIVLLEMLRDRPFAETKVRAELAAAAIDPSRRPTPSNLGITVSKELSAALDKAVARSPSERWQSAAELLAALRAAKSATAPAAMSLPPKIDEWSPDDDDTHDRSHAKTAPPPAAMLQSQATVRLTKEVVPTSRIASRPAPPFPPAAPGAPRPPMAPSAAKAAPPAPPSPGASGASSEVTPPKPMQVPAKPSSGSSQVAKPLPKPPIGAGTIVGVGGPGVGAPRVVPPGIVSPGIPSSRPRALVAPSDRVSDAPPPSSHPTPPPPAPGESLPPPPPPSNPSVTGAPALTALAHGAAHVSAAPPPPPPPPPPPAPPIDLDRSARDLSTPPKAHVEEQVLPSVIVDPGPDAGANGVEEDASLRSRETVRLDRAAVTGQAAPTSGPQLWPSSGPHPAQGAAAPMPPGVAPMRPPTSSAPTLVHGSNFEARRARARKRLLITALLSFVIVFVVGGGLLGGYFYVRAHPHGVRAP